MNCHCEHGIARMDAPAMCQDSVVRRVAVGGSDRCAALVTMAMCLLVCAAPGRAQLKTRHAAGNLVANGNFAAGTRGWALDGRMPAGAATLRMQADSSPPPGTGGRVLRIDVQHAVPKRWNLQLHHAVNGLVNGRSYTVSLWVRGERERGFAVYVGQDIPPRNHLVAPERKVTLTQQWTHISYAFVADQPPKDHTRLSMVLGEDAGPVELADVRIEPGGTDAGHPGEMRLLKRVPGDLLYHFLSPIDHSMPPTLLPAPDGQIIRIPVPLNMRRSGALLELLDMAHGNAARIAVDTTRDISITPDSLRYLQTLIVPVVSRGKPVFGAQITLLDAGPKRVPRNYTLKSSDNGLARFEMVPIGEPITIRVAYAGHEPETHTRTLPREHPASGYVWQPVSLDWPDVKTLESTLAVTATEERSGASGSNAVLLVLSLLLLFLVAGGVFFLVDSGRLNAPLARMGIRVTGEFPSSGAAAGPAVGGVRAAASGRRRSAAATELAMGKIHLLGTQGAYAGASFSVTEAVVRIGRDTTNTVPLSNDGTVSRNHAIVHTNEGVRVLMDIGSANGTYHNGVRIERDRPCPLALGDEVQIGTTRFMISRPSEGE